MIEDHIGSVNLKSTPFEAVGDSGQKFTADSIIISTGAQARWLGFDIDLIFQVYGVSACATCDGFFFKDKEVVNLRKIGDTNLLELYNGPTLAFKDIAMQISANAPLAIYPDEIDQQILDKEKEIALATIENDKKPNDIKEKIVTGKLKKFKDENSLTEQAFIKNPDKKIKDLLGNNKILGFLRKKVGE